MITLTIYNLISLIIILVAGNIILCCGERRLIMAA